MSSHPTYNESNNKIKLLLENVRKKILEGNIDEGIALIEKEYNLDPDNNIIAGNLAGIYLSTKQYDKAIKLYERLLTKWRNNPEVEFRLLQARIARDGYSSKEFIRMIKLATKITSNKDIWYELLKIDKEEVESKFRDLIIKKAYNSFPDDTHFLVSDMEIKRIRTKKYIKTFMRITQLSKLFNLLLKSSFFRRLLREATDSSMDYIYSLILDQYRAGSVNTLFHKSRPEWLPENFDKHFSTCKCSWFNWMKNKLSEMNHTGLKLIDIGSGCGFISHHFLKLGYQVTALSGNAEELTECKKRGMRTLQTDMHHTNIPSSTFDVALVSHVLEHSVAPLILLWEIKRILKPGGLLHIHLPYPIDGNVANDYPDIYDKENDCYKVELDEFNFCTNPVLSRYTYGSPLHIFVLSYWQWRWVFKNAGFEYIDSALELPDGSLINPEHFHKNQHNSPLPSQQIFILKKHQ